MINLKDQKNRVILYLSIGIIVMFGVALLNNYDLQKYKEEVREEKENNCWWWILDDNLNGISGKTHYNCGVDNIGFKNTCESSFHNLNCEWIDNTYAKGCMCFG